MPDEMVSLHSRYESESRYPELSAKPADKRPLIIGIVVAVALILIFGAIGVWLFLNPASAAVLRDIFIIFLGLGVFLIILLLIALVVISIYLVIKINDLIHLVDREIRPVLNKLLQTSTTVQGTATFIGEHAVRPVITTVSTVAGIRAVFRALFQR